MFYPNVSTQTLNFGTALIKEIIQLIETQFICAGMQDYIYKHVSVCLLCQPSLWYHSSSVLALALDTLTAPYRLRNNSVPMWQLADDLAVSGRKVFNNCSFIWGFFSSPFSKYYFIFLIKS